MKHYLAETRVNIFVEPAGAAFGDGHCPMNNGIALVKFAWQAGKVKAPVRALAGKARSFADCTGPGIHGKDDRADSRPPLRFFW